MKAKLSLLIPLLTIVGLVACTAPLPAPSTTTVAPSSTTTITTTTTTTINLNPSVRLYDNNNTYIGELISTLGGFIEVFNTSLGRSLVFDGLGRIKTSIVYYDYLGCTGEPYFSSGDSYPVDQIARLRVLKNTLNGQNYFIVDPSYPETYKVTRSHRDENDVCTDSTTSGMNVKLIKVSLQFTEPLIMPLSLKYE